MSDDTRCDWCLRPAAPEEWESATTGEQRDGYCWGPGDALCDELHEAEWERMLSEVARLRGLLRDMEYGHYPDGLASLCPVCHLTPRMGHSVDCRLAAALEEDHG